MPPSTPLEIKRYTYTFVVYNTYSTCNTCTCMYMYMVMYIHVHVHLYVHTRVSIFTKHCIKESYLDSTRGVDLSGICLWSFSLSN